MYQDLNQTLKCLKKPQLLLTLVSYGEKHLLKIHLK